MDMNQLMTELRALANRWAIKAREFARDGKNSSDQGQAQYYKGFAEGYYKAATELAAVLKGETAPADGSATLLVNTPSTAPARPAAPAAPVSAPPTYIALPLNEIINVLEFSGASARDVKIKPGNTVYAEFSRWQPLTEHERVAKIAAADPRVVILNFGRTKDTNDPYVEFAFKQG